MKGIVFRGVNVTHCTVPAQTRVMFDAETLESSSSIATVYKQTIIRLLLYCICV